MIKQIKAIFEQPSAELLAQKQLEDAKRRLLEEQEASEFHARMVEFHLAKIKRLTAYVKESTK